ncbi:hypothetical protein Hanom_Chr07g00638101 [Helianthus anomalus]
MCNGDGHMGGKWIVGDIGWWSLRRTGSYGDNESEGSVRYSILMVMVVCGGEE